MTERIPEDDLSAEDIDFSSWEDYRRGRIMTEPDVGPVSSQ